MQFCFCCLLRSCCWAGSRALETKAGQVIWWQHNVHFKLKSNFKALFLATARLLTPQMRRPQFRKSTSAVTKCCSCGTSHTTLTLLCEIFKDVHQRCSNVFSHGTFRNTSALKSSVWHQKKGQKCLEWRIIALFYMSLELSRDPDSRGKAQKLLKNY